MGYPRIACFDKFGFQFCCCKQRYLQVSSVKCTLGFVYHLIDNIDVCLPLNKSVILHIYKEGVYFFSILYGPNRTNARSINQSNTASVQRRKGYCHSLSEDRADQKDERPPYGKRLLNSSAHKFFYLKSLSSGIYIKGGRCYYNSCDISGWRGRKELNPVSPGWSRRVSQWLSPPLRGGRGAVTRTLSTCFQSTDANPYTTPRLKLEDRVGIEPTSMG